MVEERAEEEEGQKITQGRSPPPPRKRPFSSFASCPSLPPLKKKAGDLPDLFNCHSCGLHLPSKARAGELQTLDSQWRIVLLCKECLARIRSAAACSYCFSEIRNGSETETFLDCRQCSCRVHVSCIPHQRGFILLSDLDPDSFICVDCCALPRYRSRNPQNRNPNGFGSLLPNSVSRASLEDLVRDADSAAEKKANLAARAKEKALKKAEAARRAAVLARNALNAVIVAKDPPRSTDPVVADEELALQLHLAMNGSQRISRSSRTTSSDHSDLKKAQGSCKKVEFCTEDKAFFECTDWNASIGKDLKEELHGQSGNSSVLVRVKEEQESCSEKVASSGGDENTKGSELTSCQKDINSNGILVVGGNSSELQEKSRNSPNRYVKKYSKRNPSLKRMMNSKESQLVACWKISCSKTSSLSDTPYQSTAVPMHPSAYSSLSGCQS